LAPPEEVDEVVDQDPQTCENCGESLENEPRVDAFLRQVTETPWYKAFVKEFRLWLKACPKCGKTTRGQMLRACRTALSVPNSMRGSACSADATG
jgi:ribosomal protein S27AE